MAAKALSTSPLASLAVLAMLMCTLLLASVNSAAAPAVQQQADEAADRYALPEGMLLGAGVSAMQTEGAWDEDGKSESLMDFVMVKANFSTNHLVAADSYHRYKEDVEMAARLKLSVYKFTISWPRILPTSNASEPNWKGVQFYHNLIDEIKSKGMTPMVTLLHFDFPMALQDEFGSWSSRRMVDKFEEYAKFVFSQYASKVHMWITINEPNMYCSYFGLTMSTIGYDKPTPETAYKCIHNHNLAHAAAYRAFKAGGYEGRVGYSSLLLHSDPVTSRPEDVYASEALNAMNADITLYPAVYGDYPQIIKNLAGEKLPKFSDEEKQAIRGSTDFVGINVYSLQTAEYNPYLNSSTGTGLVAIIMGALAAELPFVTMASISTEQAFGSADPLLMRNSLVWTHNRYGLPIVITENGFSGKKGMGVHDRERAVYFSINLRSLVTTAKDYGIDVLAYCAWSLIDSFEFTAGYDRPFGLVHIDYAGGSLNRTLKESSSFWTEMAERRVVPLVEHDGGRSGAPAAASASLALLLATLAALAPLQRLY